MAMIIAVVRTPRGDRAGVRTNVHYGERTEATADD